MTIVCERSQLNRLDDAQLLQRLDVLARKERETTLEVLHHLGEVDRRRAYVPLGYGSLFDYCTRRLGYSHSAAGRRIAAARCVRTFPEIAALLAANEANLTTVALVAPIMTPETRNEIVNSIRGKNQREVEALVARYKPPAAYRDRVRPVCVAVPEVPRSTGGTGQDDRTPVPANPDQAASLDATEAATHELRTSLSNYSRSGSAASTTSYEATDSGVALAGPKACPVETKFLIQFLAGKRFMKKYERVRSLISNRLRDASFEDVFESVLDEFIERRDPDNRHARRQERRERTSRGTDKTLRPARTPAEGSSEAHPAHSMPCGGRAKGLQSAHSPHLAANSGQPHPGTPRAGVRHQSPAGKRVESPRHIPTRVRDKVYARDKGRCTYATRDGTRCGSTYGLHIDHILPFARGGSSTPENLRLLCARHNRSEAERVFGKAYVERYRRNK